MRLALSEGERGGPWRARPIEPGDAPAVGTVMLAAYRGTVDDEGESETDAVTEVERTLAGEYGPLIWDASSVVVDGVRIVGAAMLTEWDGHPFLAYAFVHPDAARRGVGAHLIAVAGNALLAAGHARMDLFVTEENQPAVNLYRKLGFQVVERVETPPPD
jgi:ribosomal protein S18 acetylase RimI-like enzyme